MLDLFYVEILPLITYLTNNQYADNYKILYVILEIPTLLHFYCEKFQIYKKIKNCIVYTQIPILRLCNIYFAIFVL